MTTATRARPDGTTVRRRPGVIDRWSTVLVAVAASLWATDAWFRPALARELSASQIVLVEDLIICLCFLPLAPRVYRELRRLDLRRRLALLAIAIGPQAFATVLFTRSISYAFPATGAPDLSVANEVYFLYLLQPFFGVIGARLVLGERRRPYFWPLAALAFVGVYLIVFPQDPLAPFSSFQHAQVAAAVLVIGAVALWASGTVLGRFALQDVSFVTTAATRFTFALPVLLILMLADQTAGGFGRYSPGQLPSFLGIALIPGLLAMLLYYRALASTPASLATFAELAYPCTLFLVFSLPPPVGLGAALHPAEILGGVILVLAVTTLNALKEHRIVEVGRTPVTGAAAEAAAD